MGVHWGTQKRHLFREVEGALQQRPDGNPVHNLETVVGLQPDDRFRVYMTFASRSKMRAHRALSDSPVWRAWRRRTSAASSSIRAVT